MNVNVNQTSTVEKLIDLLNGDLKELKSVYHERNIGNNLLMVINLIEKGLFGLEVLSGRDKAEEMLRKCIRNNLTKNESLFLQKQVEDNAHLFFNLSWMYDSANI